MAVLREASVIYGRRSGTPSRWESIPECLAERFRARPVRSMIASPCERIGPCGRPSWIADAHARCAFCLRWRTLASSHALPKYGQIHGQEISIQKMFNDFNANFRKTEE